MPNFMKSFKKKVSV